MKALYSTKSCSYELKSTESDQGILVMGPTRFEEILVREAAGSRLAQALAHASRATRAGVEAGSPRAAVIRDVGAGVVAPILASYMLWVLLDARARGIGRLYFIAREGQPMLRLARQLAARLGLPIECRYLYASRLSWLTGTAPPASGYDKWLTEDVWHRFRPDRMTFETLLGKIGMLPERTGDIRRFPALGRASRSGTIGEEDRVALTALFRDATFREVLARHRRENADRLRAYLAQEGAFDDRAIGIVDSGWSGSIHRMLCDLRQEAGVAAPAHCFYFGFRRTVGDYPEWSELRHWYQFADTAGAGDVRFRPAGLPEKVMIAYLELLATADHGTVIRLKPEGGAIVPECETCYAAAVRAWGVEKLHEAIERVGAEFPLSDVTPEETLALRPALKALFEAFWLAPRPDEARAWADFPLELGQGGKGIIVPLAQAYTLEELMVRGEARGDADMRNAYSWREGSLALTPAPLRQALRLWFMRKDRSRETSAGLKMQTFRPVPG
jgi:hypothetical protein